jgi:hypothetical protein
MNKKIEKKWHRHRIFVKNLPDTQRAEVKHRKGREVVIIAMLADGGDRGAIFYRQKKRSEKT